MIPNEIIEKAIEGGWPPENVGKLFPSDIVLNSEFWRCLGKALGWDESTPEAAFKGTWWKSNAHRFVDLILTQAPQEQIDAFWKDLQGKE